ncbi:hypothetical protein [Mesorhizobium retamae]|uniref:Uncharacterized protein n=1 Tax=Mesorhizobium retamae TaxID=2912854 RepID=A0ABS9QKL0_9HYPH|nr:hypothetical protein [Mesorhizobium sp. IRAMC:0171]MCG7507993.1 hypothetical protein [Mesorhizobium sp. IRAMC:0171]
MTIRVRRINVQNTSYERKLTPETNRDYLSFTWWTGGGERSSLWSWSCDVESFTTLIQAMMLIDRGATIDAIAEALKSELVTELKPES